jgi:N-acetylglucosamine-6-phosphate deacetylase
MIYLHNVTLYTPEKKSDRGALVISGELGGRTVFVNGFSAQLEDGRLAGSLLSLDQALRNLMAFTGCSLSETLITVTQVPARLLHLDTSLGNLATGAKSDLVLLTPEMQVARVWINGNQIHSPVQ